MRRLQKNCAALFGFAVTALAAACAVPSSVGVDQAGNADGVFPVKGEGWQTVWQDEFDGETLDRTKWAPEESCWGGGNNERQCYTDRPDNVQVENGVLRLIAKKERFTGPLYPKGMTGAPGGTRQQDYTSGKVRTLGLAAFKYGRISARIMLPEGQGTWPAFWMMPEASIYGDWPLSGELDIMEAVNLETVCEECPGGIERQTSGALHFGGKPPKNEYLFHEAGGESDIGPSRAYQVYSVEWSQSVIQWLVDGKVFMRLEHDNWYTDAPEAAGRKFAPFDQPFYIAINFAVGGRLSEESNGAGFDPASYPSDMKIDWVRVEQCGQDQDTGLACLSKQNWQGQPKGPWEIQAR